MNYKQKKHFRQNLDFDTAILDKNLFFVFQLKPVNVVNWLLLKKFLLKHNLGSKIFSIKSFQKDNLFNIKSKLITNIYRGKILIVYSNEKLIDYRILRNIILHLEKTSFLLFLHVGLSKNFFSLNRIRTFIEISSQDARLELLNLLSGYSSSFIGLIDESFNKSFYIFKKAI